MSTLHSKHIKVFGDFITESQEENDKLWVILDNHNIFGAYNKEKDAEKSLREMIEDEGHKDYEKNWERLNVSRERHLENFTRYYPGDTYIEEISLGEDSDEEKYVLDVAIKSENKGDLIMLIDLGVNPFLHFKNMTECKEYIGDNFSRYVYSAKDFERDVRKRYAQHIMKKGHQ